MFPLLVIAATQVNPQSTILVGGWDRRSTLTVAEGTGRNLGPLKIAAEACGFSRTWVWDDGSGEAQLWVLAAEASREKKNCLNGWRTKHRSIPLTWKVPPPR